jgi:large subunit ribosomal protein L19e
MDLHKLRRLAIDVLNVGKERVWFDPEQRERIKEAMTKDDVRALVAEQVVKKKQPTGQSSYRTKKLKAQKKKGRKRGFGKRKGTSKARLEKKRTWIKNVRAQRRVLKELKDKEPELFETVNYAKTYRKITGGYFKGKKYVEQAVKKEAK